MLKGEYGLGHQVTMCFSRRKRWGTGGRTVGLARLKWRLLRRGKVQREWRMFVRSSQ